MNNKAHLRPKDYDSNGDIIPMACREEKGDLISREALKEEVALMFGDKTHITQSVCELIDNAPTVEPEKAKESEIIKAYTKGFDTGVETVKNEIPQGELKEYKPLKLDYNVKSAVENLKTAYWSNDTEKYAKAFTEAEEIIVNAICHHGYIVTKGGAE